MDITCKPNGPYLVKGASRLVGPDGQEREVADTMALCRCGRSADKPFCDGTHSKVGFEG